LKHPSNFGACLTVRKKWLLAINGYEQHPIFGTGFHANGNDINTRFKNLGLPIMWHPGIRLYHPWHIFTTHQDPIYDKQHAVIRYRAVALITQAFEGIDSTKNIPFPETLISEIALNRRAPRSIQPPANGGLLRQLWKRLRPSKAL
jgi:hypothetical protein